MQYVGFAVLLLSFLASLFAILEHRKGKRVLATPLRKTGYVTGDTTAVDLQGNVSCEGDVQ